MALPGLFQSDGDLDTALELALEITGAEDGPEVDALVSFGAKIPFNGDSDGTIDASSANGTSARERLRQKFDAGLAANLIDKYRNLARAATDEWAKYDGQYRLIILSALVMGTGAKIADHHLQHLRQLAVTFERNHTFDFASAHTAPSKRQFLAALDNYQPGIPRDFTQASCLACGRTLQDTARPLSMCRRCSITWCFDGVGLEARR
jgi:hypothetical protein